MAKGIHRVAAGTKRARQIIAAKDVRPSEINPEIKAWNDRIEALRKAKQTIQPKE